MWNWSACGLPIKKTKKQPVLDLQELELLAKE
jgi:hypothetical protein